MTLSSNASLFAFIATTTLVGTLPAQGYPESGTPTEEPANTNAPTTHTSENNLPDGVFGLHRHKVTDAQMGGAVSHTLLVPDGWKIEAMPLWTQNPATIVEFVGSVMGPDGEELGFFPTMFFSHTDDRELQQRMGGVQNGRLAGNHFVAAPRGPGQAVKNALIPLFRPKATNVQVLHTEPIAEINQMLAQMFAPQLQQAQQMNQQGGSQMHMWHMAERVVVSYDEEGHTYEEEFHITQAGTDMHFPGGGFMPDFGSSDWRVMPFRSARTKQGKLKSAMPMFTSLALSLQEDPRWHNAVAKIRMEVSKRQHEGRMAQIRAAGEASKKISQTYSEISDMRHDSWKKQQASNDRSGRAFTNAIAEVDDYKLPGGGTVSLNSNYRHVYTDGSDRFIYTDNPNFEAHKLPGQWQAISPVTPSGGAANY